MDATHSPAAELQKRQDRKRRRKALLAGGVVLGLGAAVTLAAWSDDVFADGTFDTGGFELQGSTNGDDFFDYDGPGPGTGAGGATNPESASLSFNLDALKMTPSQTVYAPLTIRTSPDTKHAGEFFIGNVSATGKYAPILTYRIYDGLTSHGQNCNAAGAGSLPTIPWTSPTGTVDDYLNVLSAFNPDGESTPPLAGILGILGGIPLIGDLTGLLDDNLSSRSVLDPTPGVTAANPLEVGAETNDPQYLCLAVTMGLPTSGPLLPVPGLDLDPLGLVNSATVSLADATLPDGPTVVTWEFTGFSKEATP